jgi:hypothetical protein
MPRSSRRTCERVLLPSPLLLSVSFLFLFLPYLPPVSPPHPFWSLTRAASSANSPEFVPGMHYNPRGPLG